MDKLVAFFALDEAPTIWGIINAPFFTAVIIGAAGLWLQRRIKIDNETTPQVRDAISESDKVSKEVLDSSQTASINPGEIDHRKQSQQEVRDIKSKIDSLIAADPDRRHHRVYERLGKRDYKALAQALWDRGMMYDETRDSVMPALARWDQYARGKAANKPVPAFVWNELKAASSELDDDVRDLS